MSDHDDLIDEIETFQEIESLRKKVGNKRRLTLEEIERLTPLKLSKEDKNIILKNSKHARHILRQKYKYEL